MSTAVAASPARFAALHNSAFRTYFWSAGLAMTADYVEHVLGYWIIWELTHSPFWLGFAVIAHWVPYALFSFSTGSLVDRFSRRWLVQVSQVLYVSCSLAWGVLWLTGQLQLWHVVVILLVHGLAGVFFDPTALVIVHDFVGERDLMSALSLNAALRQASILTGPIVGGILLATVGSGLGFLINVLIYLPLSVTIQQLPVSAPRPAAHSGGWAAMLAGLRLVRQHPSIVGLLLLTAVPALLIGSAFLAIMPAFAERLGVGSTGYSILLASSAAGAVGGVIGLGALAPAQARSRIVVAGTCLWAVCLGLFATSLRFELSLVLLMFAGIAQIVSLSMAQTLIQRWAPAEARGRIMGIYVFCQLGLRVGSGLTLGVLATAIGAPLALGLAAALIVVATVAVGVAIPSLWME